MTYPLRPDDTPDYACVEKDFATRTGKVGGLLWSTDAWDVGEGPLENADLYKASPQCCDELTEEKGTRWHLHVVAHLLIRGVGEALRHSNIAQCLEHHHGDRSTREQIRDDVLSEHIQTNLNILWYVSTQEICGKMHELTVMA